MTSATLRWVLIPGFIFSTLVGAATTWLGVNAANKHHQFVTQAVAAQEPIHNKPSEPVSRKADSEAAASKTPANSKKEPSALAEIPDAGEFDPLDATPEQIKILARTFKLAQEVKARENLLVERERVLELARAELERKISLFERNLEGAKAAARQEIEADVSARRKALDDQEAAVKERDAAVKKLASKIAEDVNQRTQKTVAVYQNMKPKRAAAVLSQVEASEAAAILYVLPDDQRAKIVAEMDPKMAGALLRSPFASEISGLTQRAAQ